MHVRRAVGALSVLAVLLTTISGGDAVARAQTGVDEADERARQAEAEVDAAYRIVDEAAADRDAIEAELFETLDAYTLAGELLVEATNDLDRIARSLAFAEASAAEVQRALEVQAVAAYVEAVSATPSVVLDTSSVEGALVVDEVFRSGRRDTLSRLDDLVVRRRELDLLRTGYEQERVVVAERRAELDAEAEHLARLFARANETVAEAFADARRAEAGHAAALDDLEAAQAREEARRREAAAAAVAATSTTTTTTTIPATTTTVPPATTTPAPGPTSTTTTVPPTTSTTVDDGPAIPISSRVLAWLPLLERHFAPDLVDDSLVIMQCESVGDAEAYNPSSGASGLFQFLPGTWAVASVSAGVGDRSVFDGEANIIAASWLAEYYRARGYDPWRPWTCRKYL